MQLNLTDDQALFRETAVRFIETELPLAATRALHDDPSGYDRAWLAKSAALGWFAMLVPEADGGGSVSGEGLIDATIVAEELGRRVQPGPFVSMNVVADAIVSDGSAAQRADLLPRLAGGELVATWAFASADGVWDAGAGLRIDVADDHAVLTGCRGFVLDAVSADVLLVVGEIDGRTAQALVPTATSGLRITPLSGLDLSRRLAHVHFDGVQLPSSALLGGDATLAVEAQLHRAVVLNCAEMVGAMDALFTMTVEYAKDRIAFGRPIGSFQALKHVMADQAVFLETAKAAAAAAARAVQDDDAAAAEIASMAAAYVGDTANELAQECLQIHGGIGYTWEHDLHLFLRRLRSSSALYGEPTWHRERVCRFHGLAGSVAG